MASSKFNDIWRVMDKYTFEMDPDAVYEDLKCLLCKRLMIDACQTACGCQYCYRCIEGHTKVEDTFCPGGKEVCKEEHLVLERDVMRNIRINNRIYKLTVVCPNELCRSMIELTKMEEHLRVCTNGVSECPYSALGCDKLQNHVYNDTFSHTELVVELINNLRNEVASLKDGKSEIQSLKEESKRNEAQFEELMSRVEEEMNEMVEKMQEELRKAMVLLNIQKRDTERMREESKHKDNLLTTMKAELEELRVDLALKIAAMWERIEEKERDMQMIAVGGKGNAYGKLHRRIEGLEKEVNSLRAEVGCATPGSQGGDASDAIPIQPRINAGADYEWKVTHLSTRHKTLYSDGFYSQKYQFCLSAFFTPYHMSIWCYILKGANDDTLPWPMKHSVTLSILDQGTHEACKSETFQYGTYNCKYKAAFGRPSAYRNEYSIGMNAFVTYSRLPSLDSVIVNDSIILSFRLTP